ncbi:MAG: aldo/keto reductase [Rhizobiales bacterium]|nr:aldo/keto reductase [Hyphomicrobiales bacterium]
MERETITLDLAQLGLGLTGIGRVWGHAQKPVPPESEARALLEKAFELGIQVYDTAPAYGLSEQRLGAFLKSLSREQRENLFIATKFGEHWNDDGTTRVDHSYDALMRSLDRSLERLGDVDLVQVHKASVAALQGEDLRWALEAAQAMDIPQFGASVNDLEAGRLAIDMGFHWLQLPLNIESRQFEPLLAEACAAGVKLMTNRPFANGAGLAGRAGEAREQWMAEAVAYVRAANPDGIVLTGTSSVANLIANHRLFHAL